jgi:hypothetical protein
MKGAKQLEQPEFARFILGSLRPLKFTILTEIPFSFLIISAVFSIRDGPLSYLGINGASR